MRASTLFLAAVTATAIYAREFTLTELEALEESEVTPACYAAYTAPIAGCRESQNTCSKKCISSLKEATSAIRSDCSDAFVGMGALLRRIVDGGLTGIVCPDYQTEFSDSTLVANDFALATTILYIPTASLGALETADNSVAGGEEIVQDTRAPPRPLTTTRALVLDTAPSPTGIAATSDGVTESAFPSGTRLDASVSVAPREAIPFGMLAVGVAALLWNVGGW